MDIDMGAITTLKQNNKPWTLTWKASGRYPIVADRIFATLADAQAYVDDTSAKASATGGLILSVISDSVAKNNGVYYVKSVANTDPKYGELLDKGTLVKVGGSEIEFADTYSDAVKLSTSLVIGQMIKVDKVETVGENVFKAGFYIVETPGTISALDTSTGSSDEIGAIKSRVDALEGNRVLTEEFNEYKEGVSSALGEKANVTDLTNLEKTVNDDIEVLTTLIDDYKGTLGDVDDRLGVLEEFVEAHESIDILSIEALFAESEE